MEKFSALAQIDGRLEHLFSAELSAFKRSAHTDIPPPDFDDYRRESVKNPNVPAKCSSQERKVAMYVTSLAAGVMGLYAYKSFVVQLAMLIAPSRDVLAIAQTEFKIKNIPEGKVVVAKWRGKPVFVYHRSQETIEQERTTNVMELRDPEADEARVQRPEWLVVIGICTHLGCVPIPGAGIIRGGFYCPCHGSHYDGAGRIRKGPAPRNLDIPEYHFIDDETLLIG
ncbi:cytochrome b-c1 complex subunit Rieske, mitochondrial-like [Venturia canescens]|uniref:cytochrome b-c1 complex subunit Rieske, mitochondrial-like n=1 Tax=Venturia canescens TaxID=32260 RepID=UPI001C9D4E4D|nr:cytochrome b-c1 complex subunit Rieske, mitochondrial-like [Venturia canescens]